MIDFCPTQTADQPAPLQPSPGAKQSAAFQPPNNAPDRPTDIAGVTDRSFHPIGEDMGTTLTASNDQILVAEASASLIDRASLWREASAELARIAIDPSILGGTPRIRGTRISVAQIMDVLADTSTIKELLAEFDGTIELDDVQEALVFAARLAR